VRRARRRSGSALAEYLGVVVAVGVLMLGLLALREHEPSRTPPIAPVERLARLIAVPRPAPRPRVRPRPAARPRPPRAAPARPPRPKVLVPGWAVGW
jgi:hypothetical protein